MSHYKLKATNSEGEEVVGESLELNGNKSFKVFPVEKNETKAPIRGSVVVSILGKNHSIQLNHRIKTYDDPEPSSTKWSYIENLYSSGTTPIPSQDIKSQDTAYVRASRGKTVYNTVTPYNIYRSLLISRAYTTYQSLLDSVGDFSDDSVGTHYSKGSNMLLFTFTMFYKYSTEVDGVVIPPVDDDTPESNKARIPGRPDKSGAPDWIRNGTIIYKVDFQKYDSGTSGTYSDDSRTFNTWDSFIAFWDSICTNPEYRDAVFHYIYQGVVDFNESLNQRGSSTITISEIDNGKGMGIHGIKPVYLSISQQEGKNIYGASIIDASSTDLDTQGGEWNFNDLTDLQIVQNKLSLESTGTYRYKPKFRLQSYTGYAKSISTLTGGSVLRYMNNPDVSVDYQYIGMPFILRLFKENANGIERVDMRPYYKSDNPGYWKDFPNILGAQNFNPLQYDRLENNIHYLNIRESGFRGFLDRTFGLCLFQLIPIALYREPSGVWYGLPDDIDGEGGIGTKGVNYVNRYNNYNSAIGSVDNNDKYKAAFLKWPNEDGNNSPDHISPGIVESLLSKMGKTWENSLQNDNTFYYISRVMMVPVLWTHLRLEETPDLCIYLNENGFGYYLLSPGIRDSEIDINASDIIYRIGIDGLDIQFN